MTRLEDLQGMKIRVAESSLMEAIVLQLGADPVRIPYDDVYSALAKREDRRGGEQLAQLRLHRPL